MDRKLVRPSKSSPQRAAEKGGRILQPDWCTAGAVVIGLAGLMLCAVPIGQTQNPGDSHLKAAYVHRLAKSVEWPKPTSPNGTAPFIIGVVGGEQEFIDALRKVIEGDAVETHPIVVRRVSTIREMDFCHVVFFRSPAEQERTANAIADLATASILLVGEEEGFLRKGGMINLISRDGSVRFEFNKEALDRANLHLGGSLLAEGSKNEAAGERRLKVRVPPVYPDIARRMKVKGVVQLEILIGPEGTVKDVKILGGHPLLVEAVVSAVRRWRYEPAAKDTQMIVRIEFEP